MPEWLEVVSTGQQYSYCPSSSQESGFNLKLQVRDSENTVATDLMYGVQVRGSCPTASSMTYDAAGGDERAVLDGARVVHDQVSIPDHYALNSAYPNPFNTQTAIRFVLS